ncbi:MAG: hypothetical protein DLM54_09875 [Acidimicrobiales bacterium]|nr:MAG: hypothetical protein DLM54_09875 [Acidimicrobiales bacterium]
MAQNRAAIRQEIINNRTELGQTIRQLGRFDMKAQAQHKFQEVKPVVIARARERAEELIPEAKDKYVELKPVVLEQAKEKWAQLKPVVAERSKEKEAQVKALVMAKAARKLGPIQHSFAPIIEQFQHLDYVELVATVKRLYGQVAQAVIARLEPAVASGLDQLSRRSAVPALKRALPALKRGS